MKFSRIFTRFFRMFQIFLRTCQSFYNFYAELNRILLICYLKLPRNLSICFRHFLIFKNPSKIVEVYQNYHKILLEVLNFFYLIFSRTSLTSGRFPKTYWKSIRKNNWLIAHTSNCDSTRNLQHAQGTVFNESDNANSVGMFSPSKAM